MTNQVRTNAHYFDDDIGGEQPLWALLTMQGEFMFVTDCASCMLDECSGLDERERNAILELHELIERKHLNDDAKRLRRELYDRFHMDIAYERNIRHNTPKQVIL